MTQKSTNIEPFKEVIPLKTKVTYGFSVFGSNILSGLGLGPITYYYNVFLGLEESLVGIAWLLFIFWNMINDPLFGFIEDRTKSEKYGRRIPYLRFGAPIYTILFIFCWFPLVDVNNEIALFFNFLFILYAFDTIFTIVGLIYYSMPAEMAVTSKARSGIMVFSSIFGAFGGVLTYLLPILLLTGSDAPPVEIFLATMVILGIICGLMIFVGSYFVKENRYAVLEESLSYWSSIAETFKNKPFLIFEAGNFFITIAQYILTSSMFYYFDFVLELTGIVAVIPLMLFFIISFAFSLVFNKLLKKFELKSVFMWNLILWGLSFFLWFLLGWNLLNTIFVVSLVGISISGLLMTSQMVVADIIDYDEIRTGKRRETSYAGVNALITKPAVSLAPWIFLTIIDLTGFVNAPGVSQSDFAKLGIMIGATLVPSIFAFISAAIIVFYPLHGKDWIKKKEEIQKVHKEKEEAFVEHLRKKGKI